LLTLLFFSSIYGEENSSIKIKLKVAAKLVTTDVDSANILIGEILKSKEIKQTEYIAYAHAIKGQVYFSKGNYQEALQESQLAIELSYNANSDSIIEKCAILISDIFIIQKDFNKAIYYLEKSLDIAKKINDNNTWGKYHYTYSSYLLDFGDTTKAKEELNNALQSYMKSSNLTGIALVYNQMGMILFANGIYTEANKKFLYARSYALKNRNLKTLTKIYNNIGLCAWNLNKLDTAIYYFKKAIDIANKVGIKNTLPPCYLNLSGVYEEQGKWAEALEKYKQYHNLNDSIFSIEQVRLVKAISEKYENQKKENEIQNLQWQRNITIASIILALFIAAFVWRQNRIVNAQKREVEAQKLIVERKSKETTDSINYALHLQKAILPQHNQIKKHYKNYFIYYQPKDIVAGDFYWFYPSPNNPNKYYLAAADCTGHGVPGAMVSVVCANALNRTVKDLQIIEPGKILDNVANLIIETFEKSESQVKDGMDISMCLIDTETLQMQWAGANNNLLIIRNNELIEIKADKQPVAVYENRELFTTQIIQLQKDDCVYLFTDGYADQFGQITGKKLMRKNFYKILQQASSLPCIKQYDVVAETMHNWKGTQEQVDDMCVIGLKIG